MPYSPRWPSARCSATAYPTSSPPPGTAAFYVIHPDGENHAGGPFLDGFPVSAAEPDNSSPLSFGHGNSFLASPVLADLDGDGTLEIIAAGSDQKLYAWQAIDGDQNGEADAAPGFPVPLDSSDEAGLVPPNRRCEADGPAQTLGTPVAGILDPTHSNPDIAAHPAIVVGTSETCNEGLLPTSRVYAVYWNGLENEDGPFLPGWPAEPAAPLGDSLPIPPLTIGMTSSPAALRTGGELLVSIGAFLWFPQMIYWDGDDLSVRHLPSRLNVGASAGGSFGRFDEGDTSLVLFPHRRRAARGRPRLQPDFIQHHGMGSDRRTATAAVPQEARRHQPVHQPDGRRPGRRRPK